MFSTYKEDDVTILLKDITGQVQPLDTAARERLIQSGVHYSEMLPIEYSPTALYMETYDKALKAYSQLTADAVAAVSRRIMESRKSPVLVSLARAGTSIGVLIRRYIRYAWSQDIPHYTISIIRGRGIDRNAMDHILKRHSARDIQFVDGWTGKGAIQNQLSEAMRDYPEVPAGLAVLSDPAYVAEICGTHDDFLIASSCLNSVVSGLMSRTFFKPGIIGEKDFHGAVFYKELLGKDLTYSFISAIESCFPSVRAIADKPFSGTGIDEVRQICQNYGIDDINLVKPSIGEATRVLLRRLPWKILVHSLDDHEHLGHLYQLAAEKGVELVEYPLVNYRACGLIRKVADI